jgi:hypothetical protein
VWREFARLWLEAVFEGLKQAVLREIEADAAKITASPNLR